MTDEFVRDICKLLERIQWVEGILRRSLLGDTAGLRQLQPIKLGGAHCGSFIYIDIPDSINTAVNEAVCGAAHTKAED